MGRRSWITVIVFALLGLAGALAAADVGNPPDVARYANVSPEVLDRDGNLLRAFLTRDGFWRMKTSVRDVSPRYLDLLKSYEDKRFDRHFGVNIWRIAVADSSGTMRAISAADIDVPCARTAA